MEIHEISNELIQKAANKDLNAFETIYKTTSGFVYNVALNVALNRDDALEITQEVFLKVYDNLKDFKFRSSFKTWVYRVTVNTALNAKKKNLSRTSRQVPYDEAIETTEIHENNVEQDIENKGDREILNNLLESLTPEYRTCMVLREIQGLSYQEIAESLEININTVRSRLKRAREILIKRGMQDAVR
jgi:RNA polymerase sigma-70 factor (ECF subfamily)